MRTTTMAASQYPPTWLHPAAAAATHKRLYASVVSSEAESLLPNAAVAQQQQQPVVWGVAAASSSSPGTGERVSLQQAWDTGGGSAKRFRTDNTRTVVPSAAGAVPPLPGSTPSVKEAYTGPPTASTATGASAAATVTAAATVGGGLSSFPILSAGGSAGPSGTSSSTTVAATAAANVGFSSETAYVDSTGRAAAQVPVMSNSVQEAVGDLSPDVKGTPSPSLQGDEYSWKSVGRSQAPSSASGAAPQAGGACNQRDRTSTNTLLRGQQPCEELSADALSRQQQCGIQKQQLQGEQQQLRMMHGGGGDVQATSLLLNRQRSEQDRLAIMPFGGAGGGSFNRGMTTAVDTIDRAEGGIQQQRREDGTIGGIGGTGALTNNRGVRFRALTDLLKDKEIQALLRVHASDPMEVLKAAAAAGEDFAAVAETLRRRGLQGPVGPSDNVWLPGTLQPCQVNNADEHQTPQDIERQSQQKISDQAHSEGSEQQQQQQHQTHDGVFGRPDMFFADREMQSLQERRSSGSGDTASVDSATTTAGYDPVTGEDALMVEDEPVILESEGSMKSRTDGE